jgi:hypothetical protein
MALQPTSPLVAAGWIKLAVPTVAGVGRRLPAATDAMRAGGFVRVQVVGGTSGVYVPLHGAVVVAECWWPPLQSESHLPPWNHAGQLAQRLASATYDPALMGVTVTLGGDYGPARVHTVIALDEPSEVLDDPSHFARQDVRLQLNWSAA